MKGFIANCGLNCETCEAREDPITLPLVSTDCVEHGIVTLVIPEFTQGAEQGQEYAQIVLTVGADVALRTCEVFCEEPIPPDVLTDSPEQEAAVWIRSR